MTEVLFSCISIVLIAIDLYLHICIITHLNLQFKSVFINYDLKLFFAALPLTQILSRDSDVNLF